MKKLITLIVASALVAAVAGPSFAGDTNCAFKDKTLCVTESLSPTTGD